MDMAAVLLGLEVGDMSCVATCAPRIGALEISRLPSAGPSVLIPTHDAPNSLQKLMTTLGTG